MSLINDRFMITNTPGLKLYKEVAKNLPIIDFHCHLEAKDIYENLPFRDISQLWLEGDHYKWRAMRANGIPEKLITGKGSSQEKFRAWAETTEASFGNPLYHWTHLELAHYFAINDTLNSRNWRAIMEKCNQRLSQNEFLPRALIRRAGVEIICTTDNPLDDLKYHQLLQQDADFSTRVLPTFRPDDLFETDAGRFCDFAARLFTLTQTEPKNIGDFYTALEARVDYFHRAGCRIADYGFAEIRYRAVSMAEQNTLFLRRLAGETLTENEQKAWSAALFVKLAAMYKQRNWAMQIHFGALRNNNQQQLELVGVNSGFDSINDQTDLAANLNALLNALLQNNALPKTIIYNLNASYNDVVASAIANFQSGDEGVKSPLQWGPGWWFNDTRRGMVNQLTTLADQGLLSNFIGMLTDSRSFVSYPRHDYFRRILCDLIGGWVARGEIPDDRQILTKMIRGICLDNARDYFNF